MTAVEKAELARLRVASPTAIPAFAEARAKRLADLEERYLWEKQATELTPAFNAAQRRQAKAERRVR
jgi:hypothetical protein